MAARRFGPQAGAITRLYCREFYRRCDLVIAPSAFMRTRLARWGIERVVARPLGVDLDTFSPRSRSPALRRELGLPARTRLLAYAGRFSPEKNLPVLLDAFRELGPRYHLVLAGPATPLALPSNVTLLPFLHSSLELARILASVDALVHAGDQETFGLVLLEAMACGRGVIAANAGAIPEIVTPETGVLVRPGDAVAMADGVREFYARNPNAIGRKARSRAEREYGWGSAMRGLLGLYRGALVSGSARTQGYATS
jgi:alpha-1,6-mannosyltransferase